MNLDHKSDIAKRKLEYAEYFFYIHLSVCHYHKTCITCFTQSMLLNVATFLDCIEEAPDSNLGRNTAYTDYGFS